MIKIVWILHKMYQFDWIASNLNSISLATSKQIFKFEAQVNLEFDAFILLLNYMKR